MTIQTILLIILDSMRVSNNELGRCPNEEKRMEKLAHFVNEYWQYPMYVILLFLVVPKLLDLIWFMKDAICPTKRAADVKPRRAVKAKSRKASRG